MPTKWTEPAPKYGPTAEYGACESEGCAATARTTCPDCEGDFCLGHRTHGAHVDRDSASVAAG